MNCSHCLLRFHDYSFLLVYSTGLFIFTSQAKSLVNSLIQNLIQDLAVLCYFINVDKWWKKRKKCKKKQTKKDHTSLQLTVMYRLQLGFQLQCFFFFFIYSITTEISKSVFKIINLCIMLDYFKDEPFFYMRHVYELVADIA